MHPRCKRGRVGGSYALQTNTSMHPRWGYKQILRCIHVANADEFEASMDFCFMRCKRILQGIRVANADELGL